MTRMELLREAPRIDLSNLYFRAICATAPKLHSNKAAVCYSAEGVLSASPPPATNESHYLARHLPPVSIIRQVYHQLAFPVPLKCQL